MSSQMKVVARCDVVSGGRGGAFAGCSRRRRGGDANFAPAARADIVKLQYCHKGRKRYAHSSFRCDEQEIASHPLRRIDPVGTMSQECSEATMLRGCEDTI
jgi:hypothetical protein